MITLVADEFADHPTMGIMCHAVAMEVVKSVHERGCTEDGGDVQVHRIARLCRTCRAGVITSLIVPVSREYAERERDGL